MVRLLGLQVAALMSGKMHLGIADLHSVCSHWLQTAPAAATPPGLPAFGSPDRHTAPDSIADTLR